VTEYPWWEEVAAAAAVMQGDIIESCPVAVFNTETPFNPVEQWEALLASLRGKIGVQQVRAIVMTQACDLAEHKVQNAILCPAYTLADFRTEWNGKQQAEGKEANDNSFNGYLKSIRTGRMWNFTLLRKREPGEGVQVAAPTTVVDFHEVFSLPVAFLQAWVTAAGQPRLRLAPPYREHLSQAFARFFMRVGLPVDIDPANL
jgi:hypothetical protein